MQSLIDHSAVFRRAGAHHHSEGRIRPKTIPALTEYFGRNVGLEEYAAYLDGFTTRSLDGYAFLHVKVSHQEALSYVDDVPAISVTFSPADAAARSEIGAESLTLQLAGADADDFVSTAQYRGVLKVSGDLRRFYEFTPITIAMQIDQGEELLQTERENIPGLAVVRMLDEVAELRRAGIQTLWIDPDQSLTDWHRAIFGARRKYDVHSIVVGLHQAERVANTVHLESLTPSKPDSATFIRDEIEAVRCLRARAERLFLRGETTIVGNMYRLEDALTIAEYELSQRAHAVENALHIPQAATDLATGDYLEVAS